MGLLIGAALTDEWKGKARDVLNAAEKEAVMVLRPARTWCASRRAW